MIRGPPRSTRLYPPFPYTTLFRSLGRVAAGGGDPAYRAAIRDAAQILVQLVAPMTPHLAEECWRALGNDSMLAGARSEEHTSELQSLMPISYAVFCLKKNTQIQTNSHYIPERAEVTDYTLPS